MSGVLKGVGKVFKKVVKVVKKYALPILAVAAVVLTAGAALGVIAPLAGSGGLLASVGVKGLLATVLTKAATAATIGAIGSAVTGGNVIKGATRGFVAGAVLGGVGAALGGTAAAGTTAASGISNGVTSGANGFSSLGGGTGGLSSGLTNAVNLTTSAASAGDIVVTGSRLASGGISGLGSAAGAAAGGAIANEVAVSGTRPSAEPTTPTVNYTNEPMVSATPQTAAPVALRPSPVSGLSSAWNGLGEYGKASLIQGVGGGLSNYMSSKEESKSKREEDARIAANYTSEGFYMPNSEASQPRYAMAEQRYAPIPTARWRIDPVTGKPVRG